jgi:hypothetical protein
MINSRRMRCARHVASMGAMCIKSWKENLKERLGRPRHRWEGNIKMDLKETG